MYCRAVMTVFRLSTAVTVQVLRGSAAAAGLAIQHGDTTWWKFKQCRIVRVLLFVYLWSLVFTTAAIPLAADRPRSCCCGARLGFVRAVTVAMERQSRAHQFNAKYQLTRDRRATSLLQRLQPGYRLWNSGSLMTRAHRDRATYCCGTMETRPSSSSAVIRTRDLCVKTIDLCHSRL